MQLEGPVAGERDRGQKIKKPEWLRPERAGKRLERLVGRPVHAGP